MNKAIEEILIKNNFKITKGRVGVLGILKKEHKPLSIDEINKSLGNFINLTTIYRILEKFVEKGILYQTDFRDGKSYYEYQDSHHHHIVCTKCGKKEGVDICVKDGLKKASENSKAFSSIKSHVLEFFGICKKCESC